MQIIPMFDVLPVTGSNQGQGRICYVCKLGSAPVLALFIKPELLESSGLLEAVQNLSNTHNQLQAFIVCLSGPNPELESKIQALASQKNITVPITLLPDGVLPPSVPVEPEAASTILFYRGRQLKQKFENVTFLNPPSSLVFMADASPATPAATTTDSSFAQLTASTTQLLNSF